ncbi:MAG TPA: hypothetical protein VN726_06395 [Hanamia sp.]|nr:hypothetical protein [Hanamia sp.]
MKLGIPDELKGQELFKFLKENKSILTAQKKQVFKYADATHVSGLFINSKGEITKSNNPVPEDVSTLKVSSVINTTNWFDSHSDVHIPGLWKKSLQENKSLYLLQEHQLTFAGIISDEVQAMTKNMLWTDLGIDVPGYSEALIFNSNVTATRNPFMFNEYKLGRVKNHSVGMRYLNIEMAINNDSKYYIDEFEVWNKYIDQIANKQDAMDNGYFWAVKEARVVEGSAVPIGSNIVTPTLDNNMKSTVEQPSFDTPKQPQESFMDLIKQTKFIHI